MAAKTPAGSAAVAAKGAGTAASSLRRALLAPLGVALVIGAEAMPGSLGSPSPVAFVAYALGIRSSRRSSPSVSRASLPSYGTRRSRCG